MLTFFPREVWKRVALYPVLAIILGHGCACQRPSTLTNVLLALVSVVGCLGLAAGAGGWRSR